MKKFESDLKSLIDQSNNGSVSVYLPSSGVSESSARFLAAIGTINLVPAGNNEFNVTITPDGLAYFYKKRQARNMRWIDRIFGFATGVLVTVLSGLILGFLG